MVDTAIPDRRESVPESPYAWFRLAACLILATTGCVGTWSVVVVLPAVQAEFGAARGEASMPYAATMLGFALGSVALGRIADRFGVIVPAVMSALALCAGYVLAAHVTALWQFTLIQGVLIGFLGSAAMLGPLVADISHWFTRRRGIAVGIAATGSYLAGAVWPPLIQPHLASSGWRATYIGIGVVCLVIMLPFTFALRRPVPSQAASPASSGGSAGSIASLSPNALQTLLIVAGLACCLAMSMPQVHIVAYCSDLGYGVARGAEMLAIMLGMGVVSRLASGWICDRIGGVRTLLLGSTLQCLTLFLYLPFDGLMSLYVVSLLFGLSQGGIVPSYAIIVREYMPPQEAGTRVGVVLMATILGMAAGGWLTGVIFDYTGSYQAAFLHGIGWNLVNLAIALWLLFNRPSPSPRTAMG